MKERKQERRLIGQYNIRIKIDKIISQLMTKGFIVCESPKIRKFLHQELKKRKIMVVVESIGTTGGKKSLCRWSSGGIGWDLGRIAKWIKHGRLTFEEFNDVVILSNYYADYYKPEDIVEVFDQKKSRLEIKNLINEKWSHEIEYSKWTPFDNCTITKQIKKISLVRRPYNYSKTFDTCFHFVNI